MRITGEVKENSKKDASQVAKQKLPWVLLAFMILALSAYMVYWGTQKEGFHIDEMFSMMSIRGGDLGRPYSDDEFYNTWYIASDLEQTIGVTSENAFTDIGESTDPYRNLLHIAYSFTPGEFSIWPSMVLNLITLAGSLIVIYLLSLMFIENKFLALLPGLMWGLSSAAVNLVLFIRFYSLKTLFCLLLTYIVFIAVKNGFNKWRYLIAIVLVAGTGCLIHQYFLVYAFFLTVFVCIHLLASKKYRPLLKFAGVMLTGAALYQVITGFGISYLFFDPEGRAEEAIENLVRGSAGYSSRIQAYLDIVSEAVFGSISIYVVLLVAIALIFIVYMAHAKKGAGIITLLKNQKVILWLIMCLAVIFYLLLIARIAPYQEIRYIFCITPFVVILFVSLLTEAVRNIGFSNTGIIFAVISVISMLLPIGNIRKFNLHWDEVRPDEALASYYHLPVVCLSNRKLDVAVCYWQLFEFNDRVLFTLISAVDTDAISELSFDDGLIVMYQSPEGDDDFDLIMEATGLDRYTYVADLVRHTVYLLDKR